MVNKKIQLDFTEEGLCEKIEVVQGDTGRVLVCNIIGVDMTNVSARFYAVKNSGKEIYNNCTVSQNTVTIELTEQTLAEVGIVKCQLDLRKGNQKVQSFIFDIDVTASLMAQSEYLSSDEYKVVDDLADKVEKNENKIAELDDKKANKDDYGSPLKAKTVAEMTDKKKVYVYVGTETGYINGNWYTWEETAWISGGVYNSAAIQTDKTLTQSDKAADSAIVGQQIGSLKESKISKPSIDGTAGQVLTKDENGEFVWKDVLTELDDDSVDLSKLKNKYLIVEEGVTGTNVIDESLLIYKMSDDRNLSPGYLSTTVADDTLVPQNGTYTSSFIKVEPNKTYYINREEYKLYEGIKLYNSDKTPIQFIQLKNWEQNYVDKEKVSPQRTFTTPENCSYMRIDGNEEYKDIIYVATDYPKKVIYNKNYYLNKSYIKEGSIKTQKIVWSPTSDNTYNGWVSYDGGAVVGSQEDQSTGFIIVRPNTKYTKNPKSSGSFNKQDVAFYDYRKTFISGIQLEVGEFEFTTPDNCQYVRFDMLATHKDTEYLEVVYDEDSNDKELVTSVKSLPTLYMSGDVTDMSKVNEKFVRFKYVDGTTIKRGYNTIKWQGDSSLSYPKKNYTIKLYCDKNKKCKQPLDFGWGKQNKYVLKANYIDHSHARNIVSARLWSQIVNSRGTYSYTNVKDTPNNGAIDGMPIIVYLNGTYLGLYTLNIPKDKWMFGMDDGISTQAVLGSENYVEGCFRSSSNPLNGWSAEFPDELPTEIQTSFNTAYNFVANNTGADFKSGLSNYFDVASLIDYYIFGYVICHLDGFGKNQLLATYDGIHWSMMAYDMDSTFGLFWNGSKFVSTDYRCQEDYQSVVDGPSGTNGNELFNKLKDNFKAEIYERYTELREDVLSLDNIKFEFEKFINSITSKEYVNDIKTNTGVPQKDVNHLKQIEEYIETRLPYVDTKMKELNG